MLTQLLPVDAERAQPFDPFSEDGLARLRAAYEPPMRDWFRLNFIQSVTGSAAGLDGTSESLTNRVDRRILGVIRSQADLVLVGAQSVRAEGYRIPKTATLAIVTMRGDLTGHRIEAAQQRRLHIIGPPAARDQAVRSMPGAEFIEVELQGQRLAAEAILDAVRGAGYRSIACEGGPSLAAQFAAARLVDELCLSTAPTIGATSLATLGTAEFEPLSVRLRHLLIDGSSALYARWVRESAD